MSGTDLEVKQYVYGRRQRIRSWGRQQLRRISRRAMWLFNSPISDDVVFQPIPKLRTEDERGDYRTRMTWYLGRWNALGEKFDSSSPPDYMDSSVDINRALRASDRGAPVHRIVWRVNVRTFLTALLRPGSTTIVDPRFVKDVDTEGFLELGKRLGLTLPPDAVAKELAKHASWPSARALVLGTGPSAQSLEGDHEHWEFRIVCNSAVRDAELMLRLRPTHICFGDPVFHFGPSLYAGQFRADLRRVVEQYDSLLVVPAHCAELLARNMPWAEGRFIPLELGHHDWNIPDTQDLRVRATGNVLTQQMLPIAFALASSIDVAGADGRRVGENYFWTHSKNQQYGDELMDTVFKAHPAFFRDTDYADYYAEHCAAMESLISFGERRGATICSVTHSYIPALASRTMTL